MTPALAAATKPAHGMFSTGPPGFFESRTPASLPSSTHDPVAVSENDDLRHDLAT